MSEENIRLFFNLMTVVHHYQFKHNNYNYHS